MSNELGRLEDLPKDYVQDLRDLNLVPLWPSLRGVLPPNIPNRQTQPTHWPCETLRPLLMKAGELTPIEKAERRVLVLANPGHGLDKIQASAAMYLGMQLLMPDEWAPSHRHTPNAVRMIVEGEGAYTTVDGEKCPMSRGDLILTPTGLWHEHGHDGTDPVIWLDVLDLSKVFERSKKAYPILRYAWTDVKAALQTMAADDEALEQVQVTYTNPETGTDAENILGFYALMLRPGQTLRLPARSPAQVFHVIEGSVQVQVVDKQFSMVAADTCCAPGYEAVTLVNLYKDQPCFLLVAYETPLHRKLGVYENRGS